MTAGLALCRVAVGCLALLTAVVGLAAPASAQRFGAESFALANGLEVVVLPNHRVPAVTQMVWYKVGAADDPRGKSGIAHFLEHLMFKGTKANPPGAFSALISQSGGRNNAFTSDDYTVVLPERQVILEERRMRIDNQPSALLSEQLRANLYLNASYRIPTIGWESEMRGLGTADALAFYRDWYMPNNAILIVAGDVKTAEVRELAERNFGSLAARPLPARLRLDEPPHRAAVRLEMKSARAAQPSWRRSYLAPSYRAGATEQVYPLQVLAEILGGGEGSRLNRALVLDKGVALSADADYSATSLGIASFAIAAAPKPGVAVADLEAAINAELHRLLEQGVTADEVGRAARRMQAAAVYSQDSLNGPANIIGAALATGRSLDDVAAWPERIGAVTPAEIEAAARAVLVERNSATGILLPEHTS